MSRLKSPFPDSANFADVLQQLGNVSPRRIRLIPSPGTATERDVTRILDRENRLFELVDGVLVEKVMGYRESYLALRLGHFIAEFAEEHDLGLPAGADGTLRLMPGLVRIPDVSFIGWDRLPSRECPSKPIPDLTPHLAVEVLSESNTPDEIQRKLKEYFLFGVVLVWLVDPNRRTVAVHTAPDECTLLKETDTLDGGSVLPGFQLPLKKLFEHVGKRRASSRKTQRARGRTKE